MWNSTLENFVQLNELPPRNSLIRKVRNEIGEAVYLLLESGIVIIKYNHFMKIPINNDNIVTVRFNSLRCQQLLIVQYMNGTYHTSFHHIIYYRVVLRDIAPHSSSEDL